MAKRLALIYLIPALGVLITGHNQKYKTTLLIVAVLVILSALYPEKVKNEVDKPTKILAVILLIILTVNNLEIVNRELELINLNK